LFENKNIFSSKNAFSLVIFAVIIFALVLRTYLYKNFSAGFYCDECFLVLNIKERGFLELFLPLIHSQCCPPLFLCFAKIIYLWKGLNEHFLRLVPYFASILSVLIFCKLTFLALKNKISIIFANVIFAISQPLLIYTCLFKHYSLDVLMTVSVLAAVFYLKNKKISNKKIFLLSVFASFAVFASYTAGFIIVSALTAIFLCKYLQKPRFKKKRALIFLKSLLCFLLPFGSIMSIYFFINCLPTVQNPFLQTFWHINEPYEIFIPNSIEDFSHIFEYLLLGLNCVKSWIVLLLIAIGAVYSFKKDRFFFVITFLPFVFAEILAVLNLYPFAPDRVSLYLLPIFVLLVSKAFDCLCFNFKSLIFSVFLIVFLFNYNQIKINLSELVQNFDFQALSMTKVFVNRLYQSDYTENDFVWGDYASFSCFDVYDTNGKINLKNVIIGWDLDKNREEMAKISPKSNIFFYISEKNPSLEKFNQDAKILINENCDIIYSRNDSFGTLIKCRKKAFNG